MPLNPLSLRADSSPKGELYEWGTESFCFSGEGQPARKMQKSSPSGGSWAKAVRLWLRGFFLQGEFFKWQTVFPLRRDEQPPALMQVAHNHEEQGMRVLILAKPPRAAVSW